MILRPSGPNLHLITQPDHAALSARIMAAWRADRFDESPRREEILFAVREHDNGWREADHAPIVDAAGRLLDFVTAPDEVRRAVWPRGVARLSGRPYAAALVAQHALHVLRRYRGEQAWTRFFAELEGARLRHLDAAGEPPETLARDYFFLRIGDLLSLTFCNGWTDVQRDDTGSSYSALLTGDRLVVTPDPFAGGTVTLEIEAREMPAGYPGSGDAARAAFASARTSTVRGIASGPR